MSTINKIIKMFYLQTKSEKEHNKMKYMLLHSNLYYTKTIVENKGKRDPNYI